MEPKIKHIGIKLMVQTSSTGATKLGPTKTAVSEFFFPENEIDVSATSFCVQELNQITETNNEQV